MRSRKYISGSELLSMKFSRLGITDEWREHLGDVELGATIFVWGNTRQGKTRYILKLAKMLALQQNRTLYMSFEEGPSASLQRAVTEVDARDISKLVYAPAGMTIEDLEDDLARRNAPSVVVIDSLQYSGLTYDRYKALRSSHRKTTFIISSHADGSDPRGTVATSIMYDAGVKVFVKNYIANAGSRYGGGKPFEIWPEKIAEMELT